MIAYLEDKTVITCTGLRGFRPTFRNVRHPVTEVEARLRVHCGSIETTTALHGQ